VHDVQNLGNHLKIERTIALKKSNAMSTQSENMFQTTAQFIVPYNRTFQTNRAIRRDLNNNWFRMPLFHRPACLLRQAGRESLLVMRDDHKNDQEHQQYIDQRDYVYIRNYVASTPTDCDAHMSHLASGNHTRRGGLSQPAKTDGNPY
jgi:hypothetical protein